jgi:hypothetical protein
MKQKSGSCYNLPIYGTYYLSIALSSERDSRQHCVGDCRNGAKGLSPALYKWGFFIYQLSSPHPPAPSHLLYRLPEPPKQGIPINFIHSFVLYNPLEVHRAMRLRYVFPVLLALVAFCGCAYNVDGNGSSITYVGSPRHMLDAVQPMMDIGEQYIQAQTNEEFNVGSVSVDAHQCSAEQPCLDGSCCNTKGNLHLLPICPNPHSSPQANADIDPSTARAHVYPTVTPQHLAVRTAMTVQRCALLVPAALTLVFAGLRTSSVVTTRLPVYPRLARATSATVEIPRRQLAAMTAALLLVVLGITRPGMSSMTFDHPQPLTPYRNSRRAPCDKKLPQDLDTTGFTHLVLAFATIDPQTYTIRKMHPDEEAVYHDFVARQDGIPKYLGIGGWEFSNPGPTRRTWSQMASTKENRHAFIKSLGQFLAKWQFQGVDIHWQWPGAESRGGNPAVDTQNLVALMTELRQGLGNNFGISIALPAQYEYLKAMNPKAIEAYVDWFSMLTYDLHGPWDADVPAFGNKIRPHTDLNEIDKALKLLWASNINPSKVNLGIANYGCGYTVADKSCMHSGCPFTGASRPGECTLLAGILSRCEIQRRIKANNLTPTIISGGAGIKEITWDDQWIGYDDDETLQLKLQLANNRCLGGTALWALSYGACKKDPFEPPVPISGTVSPSVSTQNPLSSGTSRVPPNVPPIPISQSRKPSISGSFVHVSSPQAPTASSKAPTMTTSGNVVVPPLQPSTVPFTTSIQVSSSQVPIASSNIPTRPTSDNFGVPSSQPSRVSSKIPTTGPVLPPTVSKGSSALASTVSSAAPGISQHPSSRPATVPPGNRSTTLVSSNAPSPAPSTTPVRPSSGVNPSSGLASQTSRGSASTVLGPSATGVFSVPSAAPSGSITQVTSLPASSSALSFVPSSEVASILPPLPTGSGPRSSSSIGSNIRTTGTPGGSFFWSPPASSRSKSVLVPINPSLSKSVPVPINPSRTSPFLTSTGGSLQTSANLPSAPSPPVTGTSKRPTTPLIPITSLPSDETSRIPGTSRILGTSRIPMISQISSQWSSSTSKAISTSSPLRPSGTPSRAPSPSQASTTPNKISAPPQTIPTAPPSITPGPPTPVPTRPTSTANDNSPAPTGAASKCVPQDCIKECIVQRLLSFIAVRRPICVCVPKTCHEDDDDDHHHHHHHDSDSDSDDEGNCSLLGCGKSIPPSPFPTEKKNTDKVNQAADGWASPSDQAAANLLSTSTCPCWASAAVSSAATAHAIFSADVHPQGFPSHRRHHFPGPRRLHHPTVVRWAVADTATSREDASHVRLRSAVVRSARDSAAADRPLDLCRPACVPAARQTQLNVRKRKRRRSRSDSSCARRDSSSSRRRLRR